MAEAHDYSVALEVVTDMRQQLAELIENFVAALADGQVSPIEGIRLGMKGLTFGTAILTLLRDTDAAIQQDVLYVLEHAVLTVPE
jgi:hypothetical protein